MTMGTNASRGIISFKIASRTVDILHSSSPSFMEADGPATNKARGRAMAAIVSNPDHKVPCTIIEHYVQPEPYSLKLYARRSKVLRI